MNDHRFIELELANESSTCIVRLNRPEQRNAWSVEMASELNEALTELDHDDSIRVIVVTGAGDAFCVGAELSDADAFAAQEGVQDPTHWRTLVPPWSLRKPVVAAVNGHAVGVGITYALMCDLRFVADEAKIAFAFSRRGVLPELACHTILPRLVGLEQAADLLLSGRTISGTHAAEIGLAHTAIAAESVLDAALEWADELRTHAAPVSVALSKRLLWRGLSASPREMLLEEQSLLPWLCDQPDAAEGVAAFVERRTPRWTLSPTRDIPDWP